MDTLFKIKARYRYKTYQKYVLKAESLIEEKKDWNEIERLIQKLRNFDF
jgi:hypothetical protein